ncbi:MAG TPA: ATP-binding protein [Vicinamibacteria bacterium]|nr:ATP-binding protein [Vicinamibacteria bacterium]
MTGVERRFLLTVPSSTENLVLIREFVTTVGQQAGLEEADVGRLELAVDEACANVMEHAYGHDDTQEVVVRATFDHETLHIVVEDTGLGFDPGSVPEERLEHLIASRKSGGLGMRLIKSVMDEVRYEFVPGHKNELHMLKRIRRL